MGNLCLLLFSCLGLCRISYRAWNWKMPDLMFWDLPGFVWSLEMHLFRQCMWTFFYVIGGFFIYSYLGCSLLHINPCLNSLQGSNDSLLDVLPIVLADKSFIEWNSWFSLQKKKNSPWFTRQNKKKKNIMLPNTIPTFILCFSRRMELRKIIKWTMCSAQ